MGTHYSAQKIIWVSILLLVSVSVAFLLFGKQGILAGNLDIMRLSVAHDPLTELAFIDYLGFPDTIEAGQVVPIDFSVRNLEGRPMAYPYSVYLVTQSGIRIDIEEGSVLVDAGAEAKVHTSYTFKSNSLPVIFFVELPSVSKQIHATIPIRTQ